MNGAGAEQFQKTLSRKKSPNKRVNNSQKGVKDKGRGKGKGKEREVEDEELGLQKGEIAEVLVRSSTSAESHKEGQEDKKKHSEDACRQIENGGGGSSSASKSAMQKKKSDGRGGGSLGRNKLPEHKRQKQEKQSQERKDLELKAKTKLKQEGKDAGEREVVKKKVKKKKEEEEDAEEDEGGAGCRFPMRRVDKIIRNEGSDYRITHEAVFLINKATEKFLEVFSEDSYKHAAQDCKNYVSYKNLSSVVSKDKSLYFLSDYIPEKVKAEDALAERKHADK